MVGCTEITDALDNTGTNYTNTDKGVRIYWLGGAKAADNYADFYDGSWDNEANDKNESGNDAHDTSRPENRPFTGCDQDGTEAFLMSGGSLALGNGGDVRVGAPNGSFVGQGPISGAVAAPGDTRPFYGLSAVFLVASDDATLSDLTVNDGTSDLALAPAFASSTYVYAAAVANAVDGVTLTATVNHHGAEVSGVTLDGATIADIDFTDGITVPSLVVGDNEIVVTVTAENETTTLTYAVTVTRVPSGEVSADWSLTPPGLGAGDKFRLLFLSSMKRDGSSTGMTVYNTFVQTVAAEGRTEIQPFSKLFKVVGCTADIDARDNTGTTYTSDDKGVPIYWLDGNKVADDYEDFYDGSWDDEANDKNETGNDAHDTSQAGSYPLTGCGNDGTEAFFSSASLALGASTVRVGRPNSSTSGDGPLSGSVTIVSADTRPMYGLSEVFQIPDSADATLSDLTVNDGTSDLILDPAFASSTNVYTAVVDHAVDEVTLTATVNDDGAAVSGVTLDGTAIADIDFNDGITVPSLVVGDNVIAVTVTAQDTNTTLTYRVTVTREQAPPPGTVLVGNFNVGTYFASYRSAEITQRFTTGNNTAGYTLTSVEVVYVDADGDTFSAKVCTVTGSDQPTSTCSDLNAPTTFAVGTLAFTVSGGIPLAARTKYAVVLTPAAGKTLTYSTTGFDTEDSNSIAGWNIANQYRYKSGNTWTSDPSSQVLRIRVRGSVDTASTDATLSALTLEDASDHSAITLNETFLSTVLSYTTDVANGVGEITVSPEVTESNAMFVFLDENDAELTDADTMQDGFQVSLGVGQNTIKVKVTAEDGMATETYTVVVTRVDDDTPGVTVSETALTVTEQDATGDSYTVVLDTEPTADVTVTVAGHSGTALTLTPDPATLTFTTTDWETAQTVTVTAGDDGDTADDTVALTHSAASADGDYGGISIAGVAVTVEDNDTAQVTGVMVEPGNGQLVVSWTAVDNATGYKVQWKSGVEGYNAGNRQAVIGSGTTTSHTIPNLSNGTEYTVRVSATRTGANEGPASDEVMETPEIPTAPGVTVSETALTVTEQDATGDSYTVVLDTLPTADVTVTVAGHSGTALTLTPDPATLTFTTVNWETAQTVTVTAGNDGDTVNDAVALTHSAASADGDYGGISIAGVAVTVEDNDTAQVTGVMVEPGNGQLVVELDGGGQRHGLPGAVEVGS